MKWKDILIDLIDDESIIGNLETYSQLILEYNQKMNLVGFDEENLWKDGFYQSIMILNSVIKENNIELLDIGAGAGFPSIPFLIYKKNKFKLTIIESMKKRAEFLNIVKEKLNLNIEIICARAEETKIIEKFDYVTARAVTSLKNLIEISAQLGKIGSTIFFIKSKNYQSEIDESEWIIKKLNIDLQTQKLDLDDEKDHYIVSYKKEMSAPLNFPRKWNIINKKS